MRPRDLEKVRKEVERIRDRLEMPIDPKIKDLVIGLRRWGIETTASCEGHLNHGYPYPWVDIDRKDLEKITRIVGIWWSGKDKDHPATDQTRWVIKPFATFVRIVPEDKKSRSLKEMQKDAVAFGKYLQTLPDNFFTAP